MADDTLLYAPAYSKINLFLKITGRREDGYHTLESIFLPLAEPCDDIAIDLEGIPGAITVGCSDLNVPGGTSNLAGRAAERWSMKSGTASGWDINIAKHIPVAAGMGGGSSDAGTVLKLLNDHFQHPMSEEALAEMALALGADVPYFLNPEPALVTGIGEKVQKLDFPVPAMPLLLAAPEFPVSAAEAYRLAAGRTHEPWTKARREALFNALKNGDWKTLAPLLENDLQVGIFHKYPVLGILQKRMLAAGALTVVMTGSGPTLFALFETPEAAETARKRLADELPEIRFILPVQP